MNRTELIGEVKSWIEAEDFTHQTDGKGAFNLFLSGENGLFIIRLDCKESPTALESICFFPIKLPSAKVAEVGLLLHRLNQRISAGAFKLDPEKRVVAFKYATPINSEAELATQFHNVVTKTLVAMDTCFPMLGWLVCNTPEAQEMTARFQPPSPESSETSLPPTRETGAQSRERQTDTSNGSDPCDASRRPNGFSNRCRMGSTHDRSATDEGEVETGKAGDQQNHQAKTEFPGTQNSPLASQGKKIVVIAEDNVGVAQIFRTCLNLEGIRSRITRTIAETIAALRQDRNQEIGLLLLGWGFAEGTGAEVMHHVNQQCPGLPVIVMSGDHYDAPLKAFRCHADGFLAKPFNPSTLLGCVRKWLQLAESQPFIPTPQHEREILTLAEVNRRYIRQAMSVLADNDTAQVAKKLHVNREAMEKLIRCED